MLAPTIPVFSLVQLGKLVKVALHCVQWHGTLHHQAVVAKVCARHVRLGKGGAGEVGRARDQFVVLDDVPANSIHNVEHSVSHWLAHVTTHTTVTRNNTATTHFGWNGWGKGLHTAHALVIDGEVVVQRVVDANFSI
jgi:hypothetical protein